MSYGLVNEKVVPTGVKIIAVLYYIGAVILIVFGLLPLFAIGREAIALTLGIIILPALIMLGLGIFSFFIGRGLWKGRNWARIIAIIVSVLGAITGILGVAIGAILMFPSSLTTSLISIAINVLIGSYLLFNKKVKQAFA
ncbi:MAG: hypothetical protein KatS3mg001_596 [Candidatus Pacearchaeota archaeon]|nr:MAG: hypothetical protein KatS3mg001_596 [Candidatus Pacearchaeota archaeon]